MSYTRYGCACAACAGGTDSLDSLHAGSAWASQSTTQVDYPYTGDYRIDVLLDSDPADFPNVDFRWNDTAAMGSPVTVTYSFMSDAPWYGGNIDPDLGAAGFSAFTASEMAATRQIMQRLSAELGIQLNEVADSLSSYGQIRLGNNTQGSTAGYAWLPNSAGDDKSGDVWLDNSGYLHLNQVTPGTAEYATLLHEIGHALGLKHPGDYNAGDTSTHPAGNYLAYSEDNYNFTLMSYNEVSGGQERDWYGMYDLLALKALYGADPSYNAGNTTYAFTDNDGRVLKIVDDASGFDTIDLSAVSVGAWIDLRPGGFSSIGKNGFNTATNNVSIDATTTIEHLLGTNYNDHVVLPVGTLVVDGQGGIDTLGLSQARSAYQITKSPSSLTVAREGVNVTLTHVERFEFADRKLAFDFDGNAGLAAKMLGAVFGQASNPIPAYSAALLGYLDGGVDYDVLMQGVLDYQLGAQHTSSQVVSLVYTNLAGFAPSASDLAFYTSVIDGPQYDEASFAVAAADSDYNLVRIDFVGQSQVGLAYA